MNVPRRAWSLALAIFAAMLAMPLFVWLILPRPGPPPPRPPRVREKVAVVATSREEAPPPADTPARREARPAITAEAADEAPSPDVVSGTVLDSDGQPVIGAAVGCDDRSTHLTSTSDANGHFELAAEASGCAVVAHHPMHPSSERVVVQAGKDNVVKLGSGGGIEGVVVDARGSPVVEYRLTIELFLPKVEGVDIGARGRPKKFEDPQGTFQLEKLPAGKYVLAASAEGQPPGKSDTVEVEVGRTTRNVRITLPPAATLTGTVRDEETNKPIEGATVRLDGMAGGGGFDIAAPAKTDAEGAYALSGVPPGPFSVRVEGAGYRARIVPGLLTRGASTVREDITLRSMGDGGARSEFEGIGAILGPTTGAGLVVMSVVDGGPAAKAGLRRGDRVLRIDGVSALEMTLADAIQRLRGPQGSRVSIGISREGEGDLELVVTRDRIER